MSGAAMRRVIEATVAAADDEVLVVDERHEFSVRDLRTVLALAKTADELRTRCLAAHATVRTIHTGTIQGGAKVLAAMFMLDPDDATGLKMARLAMRKPLPRRRGARRGKERR